MLIQFAVENFLSFRDKTVLSMVASDDTRHEGHVVTLPDGTRVLRCAALYGANASGKSNLIKAMAFARELIAEGIRPGKYIPVKPFKLRETLKTEVKFEFELWLKKTRYSYGIVLDSRTVRSEWLYRSRRASDEMIFEREFAGSETRIKLGDPFSGSDRQRMEFIAENTRREQPFLAECEERNVTWALGPWFRDHLMPLGPDLVWGESLPKLIHDNPSLKQFLVSYLQGAGTGITDLRVEREEHASEESLRLLTQRRMQGERSVDFELSEESDGTQRLIDLAPVLFWSSMHTEGFSSVLAIDELERSLHPVLTRQFLREYLQSADGMGQLLFTT
ncbi:ATP-binding protein, partial [Haliangium sp. UPWRP_2]|uniref:AAA family ATPase n=1 Tax=Haliangium sp. UPWRP_2 TaxID=1931276 RepID=UPI000D0D5696